MRLSLTSTDRSGKLTRKPDLLRIRTAQRHCKLICWPIDIRLDYSSLISMVGRCAVQYRSRSGRLAQAGPILRKVSLMNHIPACT